MAQNYGSRNPQILIVAQFDTLNFVLKLLAFLPFATPKEAREVGEPSNKSQTIYQTELFSIKGVTEDQLLLS